ncbi:AAA family ATPase [Brevundimonas staleyi]|uniref:AAA family ATPase n=1 Tax=Brevundimonas staleyi TaxID=74326 RepID=A0ABW0FWZ1_9CAUL
MSEQFVVLSGCSGGGKSSLLAELARRGHAVVEEPGRRIVAEEMRTGGTALPWVDLEAFARRAVRMALADRNSAPGEGLVFFDRGLVDAAVALEQATGEPEIERLGRAHRYGRQVFLTPPWPEIYETDPERPHGFDEAVAEYDRLARAYDALDYEIVILPKVGIVARADFVVAALGLSA